MLFCLLCVGGGAMGLRAQAPADPNAIRLQLLSGKTGRPVTNTHLLMWRDGGHAPLDSTKPNAQATTDGEGYAAIPNTDAALIVLYVDGHQPCSKTLKRDFSLTDVRASGVVSENSCSKHIHMFPQAGTLIVFVRDETFLEKMRH